VTIRGFFVFLLVLALMLGPEWWYLLRGYNFSGMAGSNLLLLIGVVLAEALAAAIIAAAVDRALPAVGGRAVPRSKKSSRRGSQRYSAR
jgi:hypothetical protein